MSKKIVWLLVGCLTVAALVLSSCTSSSDEPTETTTTTTTPVDKGPEMVKDPVTGEMIRPPQYGGTFTIPFAIDFDYFDSWAGNLGARPHALYVENLAVPDWGGRIGEVPYREYIADEYWAPHLAESWEMPDTTTYIFNIREGVRFQNKEPVNGRELTADDVVFSWSRMAGIGEFEGNPSAFASEASNLPWVTLEATDKYTVKVEMENFQAMAWRSMATQGWWFKIYPREPIDLYGDMKDWRNAVGTGPFMVDGHVDGVSTTFIKNPDYWKKDPRFPEYQLPYVDKIEFLVMPEMSTSIAALRTGKVAQVQQVPMSQAESLQRTDPELKWSSRKAGIVATAMAPSMQTTTQFQDRRVRAAMQMALDVPGIVETYYKGWGADAVPRGVNGLALIGWYVPFEEWPEDLKAEYTYNPEMAEQYLDDAGYPRNADGIRFKTTYHICPQWYAMDPEYAQIVKAYFAAVGIDLEIKVLERAAYLDTINAHTYDGLAWGNLGTNSNPTSYHREMAGAGNKWNMGDYNNPEFQAMLEAADSATNLEDTKRLVRESDMFLIRDHLHIWGPANQEFFFWQPWVGGYDGWYGIGHSPGTDALLWSWIYQDVKEEMGH